MFSCVCRNPLLPAVIIVLYATQSEADAFIYRRRFVPELLMALHDSPLADGGAASRTLVLRTLCCAAVVPSLTRQLASYSGEGLGRASYRVWDTANAVLRCRVPSLARQLASCSGEGRAGARFRFWNRVWTPCREGYEQNLLGLLWPCTQPTHVSAMLLVARHLVQCQYSLQTRCQ